MNPSYKKQVINGSQQFPKSLVIPGVNNGVFSALYDILNGEESGKPAIILASSKIPESGKMKTDVTGYESKGAAADYHRVKSGQNLGSIADRYGMEVQDLKVWNRLKTSTVVPGQNIRLSAPSNTPSQPAGNSYMSYIVKVGDTLSGIAEKFSGMTVSKIKALNGLTRSAIAPGMRLIISQL